MKNKYIIIIFVLLFSFTSLYTYADTPIKKLGRGVCNFFTSPLEITKGIQDVYNESGIFAAFTWGILRGFFNTGVRAVVGVYEVFTFPIPFPKDYEPILTDPEFFGEDMVF